MANVNMDSLITLSPLIFLVIAKIIHLVIEIYQFYQGLKAQRLYLNNLVQYVVSYKNIDEHTQALYLPILPERGWTTYFECIKVFDSEESILYELKKRNIPIDCINIICVDKNNRKQILGW